jgi:CheY-like chemotaxis protein
MWQPAKRRSLQKRTLFNPESISTHWPPSPAFFGHGTGPGSLSGIGGEPNSHTAKARVLLVEDDEAVTSPIADLLVAWGYEVEIATGGLDALKKLAVFDPLVVLCNLSGPLARAADLVESIHYGVPDVNCIIIAESADPKEAAEVPRAGASVITGRPLNPEHLREQLKRYLPFGPPM